MAPVLNNFKTNKFQPRRRVLNFINYPNKTTPVKRLQPVFYKPNNTKVMEPIVEPVVEPIVEPVVEPVARELSKPIRRSNRIKKRKNLEIEEPVKQPKTKTRRKKVVIQEPVEEPVESEIPKERELLKRNYVRTAPAPSSEALQLLQNLYYKEMLIFGRDKLFKYIQENHKDVKISRRQIADWLKLQEINQINTRHKTSRDIKATVVKKPHKQVAMDLVDMSKHEMRGYKWLFNCIDLFSRFTYSIPMKSKNDNSALEAFKKIHKQIPDLKSVRSDNGSEYISTIFKDYLKDNNIKQVLSAAGKPSSNGAIERLNQTIKWLVQKNIQMDLGFDWVKNLPKLVKNINTTFHSELGKTPQEVENNKEDVSYINEEHDKQMKKKKNNIAIQKFKKGDHVRIHQPSDKFKSVNWSKDIYIIEKVFKPSNDYSVFEYKLVDTIGRYMNEDLLLVNYPIMNQYDQPKFFRISKLVKPVTKDNEPAYVVNWVGFRGRPTIELRKNLMEDVPKMINLFEKRNGIEFRTDKNKKVYVYEKK